MASEGLTEEQAEEKMVSDLTAKGDLKGADMIRRYQEFFHAKKSDNQTKPPPPFQPPLAQDLSAQATNQQKPVTGGA